jgi:hypothetical protein
MRLTLVPFSWERCGEATAERSQAIAYEVIGIPDGSRAVIAARPGGLSVVTLGAIVGSWSGCYGSPEEALNAFTDHLQQDSSSPSQDAAL